MKQKKMLTFTLSQLKQLYQQELPELCQLATESLSDEDFRNRLDSFLSLHPQVESSTGKQIRLLIVSTDTCISPALPHRNFREC